MERTGCTFDGTDTIIRLDIEAVKRHTEANSPAMIVEQYQELTDEHLEELRTLLAGSGRFAAAK
ncbi:hypothetical protein [Runella aurantiaca]|uniref:Uncharacterized protein n=1 Tax=Runella aurantiaca TaxID=2282308 RepID=A0A369I745_9BACT|nr:hypothetical protein [Runella aurantiaca]RDB05589.1 hypothetical protein DVG78_13485 [Runella aurantiaca]